MTDLEPVTRPQKPAIIPSAVLVLGSGVVGRFAKECPLPGMFPKMMLQTGFAPVRERALLAQCLESVIVRRRETLLFRLPHAKLEEAAGSGTHIAGVCLRSSITGNLCKLSPRPSRQVAARAYGVDPALDRVPSNYEFACLRPIGFY